MSIEMKRRGTLFVLVAPSGGGKSTVLKALRKKMKNLALSVSVTSRPPRSTETDKIDYFFVSLEEFQKMIERKEFYEWAKVHGNYYGTRKETVEELLARGLDVGMDIDVQGARAVKDMKPDAVTIFLLPPSMAVLEKRLRERKTDDDGAIRLRLANAANEISQCKVFDYLAINDDLDRVIEEIRSIIAAERHKSFRQEILVRDEPALDKLMGSNS